MIHILKKRIEEKIGTKIENRGDCELLSNAILDILGRHKKITGNWLNLSNASAKTTLK